MMTEEMKKTLRNDLAESLGMAIKLRRTELRMTLKDVAQATGMTDAAISRIEQGKTDVKLSTLAVLRSVLAFEISISKITVSPADIEPPMEPEPDDYED